MMQQRNFLLAGMIFLSLVMKAQPGKIDSAKLAVPAFHFREEYNFDEPTDPAAWKKQSKRLHVSFASTDKAWFRSDVPFLPTEILTQNETGWKGERLNILLLIWSPDTINQVRVSMGDLRNEKGNLIPKNNFSIQQVNYVVSNYPYDASEVSCGEGPVDKAWLIPDRLVPLVSEMERFNIPGRSIRPVWISVNIPANAAPGMYSTSIKVKSAKDSATLVLNVKVQNQLLPPPKDWKFRLDLWQNPWVVAEYYHLTPWSEEHKTMLKKHMKLYADAGGKYITTYAVYSPWADNSYRLEGSMIDWIKQRNGAWKFEYKIFDQYVQLAMEAGADKAITIYTPLPWGERFRYFDESTGNFITEQWLPTSVEYKKNWNVFLSDLKLHLEKKGWLNKTFLGINENAMEQTLAAIKVVKDHSRSWKITYAGDWHPELDSLLDDYSCVYGKEPGVSEVLDRTKKKRYTTYYVCCTPAKPNNFVFSPPVEGRWQGWYAQAHRYDGFLRWAYDAWPADPSRDARHLLWPAGDCFMVYPGGNSSIRYEKMREGISDYEKIRILRERTANSASIRAKELDNELDQLLTSMLNRPAIAKERLEADLNKGRKIIEEWSDLFSSGK